MWKITIFDPFRWKIPLFPYIGSDSPYIRTSKSLKKHWWGIRVFRDFLVQITVYGTPKSTKNHAFWALWTPPKIIKNRLNFAHSEICEKSRFLTLFGEKYHFSRISGLIPRISGPQKVSKNTDEVSGFFAIFWSKSQYMGPPKVPKTMLFELFGPPLRL